MNNEQEILIVKTLAEELNICFHWRNEFNILFPENKLQYELYNETAPNFFSTLSAFYFDYFFLKISKMLDPAVTKTRFGPRDNLSLYQLEKIVDKLFPDNKVEIKIDIDSIKDKANTILTARNKLISHKDLKLAINNENLHGTEFSEIELILNEMPYVINKVLELLGEEKVSFIWFRDFYGATALIRSLKQCRFYHDLRFDHEIIDRIQKYERDNKYYKL
jgi:hypothetical protein